MYLLPMQRVFQRALHSGDPGETGQAFQLSSLWKAGHVKQRHWHTGDVRTHVRVYGE